MKREELLLAAAIAASAALAPPVQAGPYDVGPGARARFAAEQGPDALRRFVERTRMIYALRYADYAGDLVQAAAIADGDAWVDSTGSASDEAEGEAGASQPQAEQDAQREQLRLDMLHE